MGSTDPPGNTDENLKSENTQNMHEQFSGDQSKPVHEKTDPAGHLALA